MAQIRNQPLLKKIALRLKELRLAQNVTQEHLYNETEIHIGRIETAKVNISVSTLSRLCKYFGISITEFFEGIEKK